jgi:hypothetical protein
MGNLIRKLAAADSILRDLGIVQSIALARGTPFDEDASRFLDAPLAVADAHRARIAALDVDLRGVRAEQLVADAACDGVVCRIKDVLWNRIGRVKGDPLFNQVFPSGVATYKDAGPLAKAARVRLLAGVLESSKHPMLTPDVVAPYAIELRAVAATLEAINARLAPILLAMELVRAQYAVNAREAQVQLARLKRYWKAMGMTESAVHAIIPDRPVSAPFEASAEASAEGATTSEAPVAANTVPVGEEVRAAAK